MSLENPLNPVGRFRQRIRNNPALLPLLTQGDSWFAFPALLRTNIIEVLIKVNAGHAAWLRLQSFESNGEGIRQMLSGRGYEHMLAILSDPTLKFAGILFSGGGNDIIGRSLLPLLNPGGDGRPWMDCINQERFDRRLQEIENAYHDLADLRDDYQPEAYILIHGYDFPIPGDKPMHIGLMRMGPWIGPHMLSKGITDPTAQRAIMAYMLKRLDRVMQRLEQQHRRVVYVRTQGTLTDKQWDDEMHPTIEGFQRIAAVFQDALVKTFPKLQAR